MKSLFKNIALTFYYSIQFIILVLCFFSYTATIKGFPWYEPLTMGPFMAIIDLIFIQALVTILGFIERKFIKNNINIISNINIAILVFTYIITSIKEDLFYLAAKVFSLAEVLLIIWFIIKIITILKNTKKIKN